MNVQWTGLEEYLDELRAFPARVVADADTIAGHAADAAAVELRAAYSYKTGNLRAGVRVRKLYERGAVHYEVMNRAPHALLYDVGTQARHTAFGVNRGRMPAANVFTRITNAHRRRMHDAVTQMLVSHGAKVRGA